MWFSGLLGLCRMAFNRIVLEMDLLMVSGMENRWEFTASYRHLSMGIGFRSPVV